jgi:hypothetical protein
MAGDPRVAFAAGSILGLAGGAFAGYKYAVRKLGTEFEERLERETAELRTFYTNVDKKKYASPEDAVKDLIKDKDPKAGLALEEYAGGPKAVAYDKIVKEDPPKVPEDAKEGDEVVVETTQVVERNVFRQAKVVDPKKPFMISQEDFMENPDDYHQVTVTYYAKDNVLTDEKEDVIEDIEATIGLDCLVNFGNGSSDPHTVHVRNHNLDLDFEIVRNESSYSREVLGLDDDNPRPEKKSARQRREGE